jgi:glutaconate CoA-transferase subunit B
MGFDEKTKRMKLLSVHPGVNIDQVKANTNFELIIPEKVSVTEHPTEKELKILRTEIDPARMILRRG